MGISAQEIQRQHYAVTAKSYDECLGQSPEHELSLYILLGLLDSLKACSVLDVGAGTGRGLVFLKEKRPNLMVCGVEPTDQLREIAYSKGVPRDSLVSGDGYKLPFLDSSFDVVMELGVLHHVERPDAVLREMIRVARFGVFLSDTNNLGQGGLVGRLVKNAFYWLGLWKVLTFLRTSGQGSVFEPNDGLWYYYSLFSHFSDLKRLCHSIHIMNTRRTSLTPWFSASHAALFATKEAAVSRSPFFANLK